MKIIGKVRSDFTGRDGATVKGQNFYATYPLSGAGAKGLGCERFYITDARLAQNGYEPQIGAEGTVMYTKQGKVAALLPVKV